MELDWKNLGFQYRPTHGFAMAAYKNGRWGALEERSDFHLNLHIAANVLQYGQACFEGLKAFGGKDGRTVIFRPDKNARRMEQSARRICMPAPSEEMFVEACVRAVRLNFDFVPPSDTGASLYLRPTLLGIQPQVGLNPSEEFLFYVFCTPVGPYYPEGFSPVEAVILDNYDRAAALGTGQAKVAGNYAAGMKPTLEARERGYPIVLFTDSVEHKYVDEFGTSNFVGITAAGEYKTPESPSILKSITNETLQELAIDRGLPVVRERIAVDSLDQFTEVGACGTAAVITPVSSITRDDKTWRFGESTWPQLQGLYQELQSIQYGEMEDRHGWLLDVKRG